MLKGRWSRVASLCSRSRSTKLIPGAVSGAASSRMAASRSSAAALVAKCGNLRRPRNATVAAHFREYKLYLGNTRGRLGLLRHPAAREVEPERQPGIRAVATEPPLDGLVCRLPPVQLRVLRPGPRVEDQPRVSPEQHHQVRRPIRPDSGERE